MALEPTFSRCAEQRGLLELSGASSASFIPLRQTAPCQPASPLWLGRLLPARPGEALDSVLSSNAAFLPAPPPQPALCGLSSSPRRTPAGWGGWSALQAPPPQDSPPAPWSWAPVRGRHCLLGPRSLVSGTEGCPAGMRRRPEPENPLLLPLSSSGTAPSLPLARCY